MLLANRVDGLIINTSGKNDAYIASISHKLPVVLLHRRIDAEGFAGDYVGSDNYQACAHLAKLAIDAGHRDIGIITSDQGISTFRERTKGFINTAYSLGLEIPPQVIMETPYTEEGGYDAFGKLLENHPSLSLVVIMNNATTIGAIQYAREHRIAIPEKLSMLSFGEILNANLMFVKPTYMTQQPIKVGSIAATLMLSRLDAHDLPNREQTVEAQLESGDSLKYLPVK
jgi:LacI family transcriptional regulator